MKKNIFAGIGAALIALAGPAFADNPRGGAIDMVPANSALAEEVHFFHNWILMPIITVISLFVLALLLWIVVRYNSKANPVAKKFSHNTFIEIVWTGVPILILLFIALPSFELLYKEDVIPDGRQAVYSGDGRTTTFEIANDFADRREARRAKHVQVILNQGGEMRPLEHGADYTIAGLGEETVTVTLASAPAAGTAVHVRAGRTRVGPGKFLDLFGEDHSEIALAPSVTIKAIGSQWLWTYAYPDFGDFEFISSMLPEDQTTPELYRFEVDNRVVVPVGETVRVITTAKDVIHSWAMPNFAIKIDAVPGRLNETWFAADREGVFYGQCSEICGVKHSFMPIAVEVVSRQRFEAWVDEQRALAGMEPMFGAGMKLAEAAPASSASE